MLFDWVSNLAEWCEQKYGVGIINLPKGSGN